MPACDPKHSGIEGDGRLGYYHQKERFTRKYVVEITGGPYGHAFKDVTLDEHVRYDGIFIRDGVMGGSNGAIHYRYREGAAYDDEIASTMNY